MQLLRVKDCGKSECRSVTGRIGDETIAPTRKSADFRVVVYREIGFAPTNPKGKYSLWGVVHPSGTERV